jgi:hypothetical protein
VDEAQWLACENPLEMLVFLRGRGTLSERKARLFAVAVCRRIWRLLTDDRSQRAVEVLEQFGDEKVGRQQCNDTEMAAMLAAGMPAHTWGWDRKVLGELATPTNEDAARAVWGATQMLPSFHQPRPLAPNDLLLVAYGVAEAAARGSAGPGSARREQAWLLRDVVGNPFRPAPAVDLAWLAWKGGAVRQLAESAYQERQLPSGHLDPARLAILADALEESGCAEPSLLAHLRAPGPHVRGCWVMDILTGRDRADPTYREGEP